LVIIKAPTLRSRLGMPHLARRIDTAATGVGE
jgi:hypothetical protein